MKKLLIKAFSIVAVLIMLIGITVGCNQISTGDIDMTLGVATIDSVKISTVDQATKDQAPTVKPTVAPTLAPTEKPSEAPTEQPTEAYIETPEVISTNNNDDYDYSEITYNDSDDYDEPSYDNDNTYEASASSTTALYSASEFKNSGVINWGDWTWTYYSEYILPGEGLYLPGRHVDNDGYICDGDGYLCIASSSLPWGTVVDTPFGKQGKVYDSGCAGYILDVYVSW